MQKVRDGYIRVPSLYVRVYRAAGFGLPVSLGSLTIREGVSMGYELKNFDDWFPHYT